MAGVPIGVPEQADPLFYSLVPGDLLPRLLVVRPGEEAKWTQQGLVVVESVEPRDNKI